MSLLDRTIVAVLPLVPRSVVRHFSARYIAGETTEHALQVVRELNNQGVMATIDVLGEDILRAEEAQATCQDYCEILSLLHRDGLDGNISVKLTALGLKLEHDLCLDQMRLLLEHARKFGNFVRIDMEDSSCTGDTLELYRELRRDFDNVGVVIQAYMRRSAADIDQLIDLQANVRLCKGIYIEPRRIAYRDRVIVQRNFAALLERLMRGGCYVGVATHDELLAWEALQIIRALELPSERYEFQMLLGVDEELRQILLDAGHRMRVYVPFGKRWYEYSMRRLKENPKIAGYAFKSMFRPA